MRTTGFGWDLASEIWEEEGLEGRSVRNLDRNPTSGYITSSPFIVRLEGATGVSALLPGSGKDDPCEPAGEPDVTQQPDMCDPVVSRARHSHSITPQVYDVLHDNI